MHFKYLYKSGDVVKNKLGHTGLVLEFIPHVGYKVEATGGAYNYQFTIGGRDLDEGRWTHRTMKVNGKGYVGNNANGNILCSGRLSQLWKGIFNRCYSEAYLAKNTTYIGSSVCDAWFDFQAFALDIQSMPHFDSLDVNGKSYYLDKDILTSTKQYSKETCVFVPQIINAYFRDVKSELVYGKTKSGKYKMTSTFNKVKSTGTFDSYEECNKAYRELFSEKGLALISIYKNSVDERVIKAIEATL